MVAFGHCEWLFGVVVGRVDYCEWLVVSLLVVDGVVVCVGCFFTKCKVGDCGHIALLCGHIRYCEWWHTVKPLVTVSINT